MLRQDHYFFELGQQKINFSYYKYTYDDAGLIIREVAKECLFASNKDYSHEGGEAEEYAQVPSNQWNNQNPEWQTTDRTFTYDNNGQLLECKENKGMFETQAVRVQQREKL